MNNILNIDEALQQCYRQQLDNQNTVCTKFIIH